MTIADLQEIERHHTTTAAQQFEIAGRLRGKSAELIRAKAAQHMKRAEHLRELINGFLTFLDIFK